MGNALEIVHYDGSRHSGPGRLFRGGRRLCVLYKTGRTLAHLLDVGSLDLYSIPLADLRHAEPVKDPRPARLARRLEGRCRAFLRDRGEARQHKTTTKARRPPKIVTSVVAALREDGRACPP